MKHLPSVKKRWLIYGGIWLVSLVLSAAAWCSTPFSDWYIAFVFPLWVNTYGRITGAVSFSVGEIMLLIGVVLLAVAFLLGLILLIRFLIPYFRKKKGRILFKFAKKFYTVFAWIVAVAVLVMTLNCTMLYHGSTFHEKYLGGEERDYSFEELVEIRNFVVERCNELSAMVERDENGDVLYEGDMKEAAILQMQKLGETYDGLKGYYPRPKALLFSDLMCQQYMQGYYFPFSMEANYNDVMYLTNKPATFCHELAHLKGYIYEDEANFIGFLACISSDDVFFRYSGYLSVLYYLDNDFYEGIAGNRERYLSEVQILPQVHADNIFVKKEEWDRIDSKAVIDTEVVEAVSDSFTETSLKLNGVEDGMVSYSRVVKLLLQYYEDGSYSLPSQQ